MLRREKKGGTAYFQESSPFPLDKRRSERRKRPKPSSLRGGETPSPHCRYRILIFD